MAALPAESRRIDQVLAAKIPEALANCVEYDRLVKCRGDEFQRCTVNPRYNERFWRQKVPFVVSKFVI